METNGPLRPAEPPNVLESQSREAKAMRAAASPPPHMDATGAWEPLYDEDNPDIQMGEWNRATGAIRPTQPKGLPDEKGQALLMGQVAAPIPRAEGQALIARDIDRPRKPMDSNREFLIGISGLFAFVLLVAAVIPGVFFLNEYVSTLVSTFDHQVALMQAERAWLRSDPLTERLGVGAGVAIMFACIAAIAKWIDL